ncbi:GTPase ObgE [Chloroflexota bacterium]
MLDRIEIVVRAGKGGDGEISFRREKFVPFGGPDGGDGGVGGNIVLVADSAVTDLRRFKQKGLYRAGNGGAGRGQKKHGKNGGDVILAVPVGTVVSQKTQIGEDSLIADLEESGQRVVVARGGRGGLGNTHFSSSTNQVPRIAQKGEAGEESFIVLEMRLIADVGIIGYPNAGKSTLLAAASAARPKVADYPFTTLEPVLGVVEVGQRSFVLAEIPGLIEGAHLGRGLGHDFLRHIMRTKMLIHLVDGSAESPVENMVRVNTELGLFDSALAQKPQLVAVNKIDLPPVQARLTEIKDAFSKVRVKVQFASAVTGEDVSELMLETGEILKRLDTEKIAGEAVPRKVFRPQARADSASVRKEGSVFIVDAPRLERLMAEGGVISPEMRQQLKRQLARLGVSKALVKAGIKSGDKIRCGNLEWEW